MSTHSMPNQAHNARAAIGRITLVGLLAIWSLALSLPDIGLPWHPTGTYGFSTDDDGVVNEITPHSAAAMAGLVVGDKLDLTDAIKFGNEFTGAGPSTRRMIGLTHLGVRKTISLVSQPRKLPPGASLILPLRRLLLAFAILIAAYLVIKKPMTSTWGFYLFCVGILGTAGFLAYDILPNSYLTVVVVLRGIAFAAGVMGLVLFALFFPDIRVSHWRSVAARIVPYIFGVLAVLSTYLNLAELRGIPIASSHHRVLIIYALIYFGVACIFLETLFRTSPEDRQRVRWVTFAFVVGLGGLGLSIFIGARPTGILQNLPWISRLSSLALYFVPLMVAYAVVRHRVLDVNFFISRAVVYTTLTSLLVAAFTLIDWFFGKQLDNSRLGTVAAVGAALGAGFWLHGLHRRVDFLVDNVLFRKRGLAERRVARVASAILQAKSVAKVDEMLIQEPCEALDLASAALFYRNDDGCYERRLTVNWPAGTTSDLDANDNLVLHLESEPRAFDVHDVRWPRSDLPTGLSEPAFAIPIVTHGRIVGIALYGAHLSGADLDPDEIQVLTMLATAAGGAYDSIETQMLKKELESLRVRLAEAQNVLQP